MFMENGINRTGWQACFLYNTLNWNFAVFKHQLVNFVNIFCSGLWNSASWTRLIIQVFPPPFEFRNPWCNSWIWRRRLSIDIWQAFVDIGCVFAFQEEKSYDCSILDSVHFEEIADFSKLTGPPRHTWNQQELTLCMVDQEGCTYKFIPRSALKRDSLYEFPDTYWMPLVHMYLYHYFM